MDEGQEKVAKWYGRKSGRKCCGLDHVYDYALPSVKPWIYRWRSICLRCGNFREWSENVDRIVYLNRDDDILRDRRNGMKFAELADKYHLSYARLHQIVKTKEFEEKMRLMGTE